MFSLLDSVGPEIPIALLLLGIMGLRLSVTPRTSVIVSATAADIFKALDIYDGKITDHGRTTIRHDLIDAEKQVYRHTYTTQIMGGTARSFTANFRIADRQPGRRLVLEREGLDGKPKTSELLKIEYDLVPAEGGTRLQTAYHWGPRPLLAQLTSRTDLWGGTYRLKSLIETGISNEIPYNLIGAAVALVTCLVTLVTFALFLSWSAALLVIVVLFIHEFGHLLAYRLIGQPWGRMLFLPFLGAVAMPRLPFERQSHAVFAALMGPGFSAAFAITCALGLHYIDPTNQLMLRFGLIFVIINIFNLLPVEPLDGGIALRSVLARLMGSFARHGLMFVGIAILLTGFLVGHILLVIFGGIAILANIKPRKIDADLSPLSSLQTTIAGFGYIAMVSAYVTLWHYFIGSLPALPVQL